MTRTGRAAASSGGGGQDKPDKRAEILAATSDLFAAKGYTGTSMRDIASDTGMLAGSLYYHFDSKEALAATMVRALRDDVVAAAQRPAVPSDSPTEAIRRFALDIADASARHPGALQVCLGVPETKDNSLAKLLTSEPKWSEKKWTSLVRDAVDAGEVSPRRYESYRRLLRLREDLVAARGPRRER